MKGFKKLPQDAHFVVKRIGELDYKPFYDTTKQIYNNTIAEDRALDLCMFNVGRVPSRSQFASFQVITINGLSQVHIFNLFVCRTFIFYTYENV